MSNAPASTSRVVRDLRELAELTSDEAGAQRLAWTDTWDAARRWLDAKARELPVDISRDEAGNQWIVLPGRSQSTLAIGGHIDSVSDGGWLDGSLGVVAGLDVLRTVAEAGQPDITVALINWADEEGARFGHSLFGSGAATGILELAEVRGLRDKGGVSLPDALAAYGVDLEHAMDGGRRLAPVRAYFELHIEQGPVLEGLDLALGVVLGTVGIRRHLVRFTGQATHAGTSPSAQRRDAGRAGARLSLALSECAARHNGLGTVGNMRFEPGLPTIVPGACELFADQRHLDHDELSAMLEETRAAALKIAAEENVDVEWQPIFSSDPVLFDPQLIEICATAVREVTGTSHRMPSGPLHDATRIAGSGIQTAMIFVRSLGGLSHCKEEDSLDSDIDLGVRALHLAASRTIATLTGAAT